MKIGTIGSGFIVDNFINAARQVEGVEIVAVYSRSEESAKAYAIKNEVDKYYYDLDTMLKNEDIDTIYVASPNSLHYSQSLKALQAKKNVITEKPFASNLKELDHLIETMKENKVMLWEAITNVYTPNLNIVKEYLPHVGEVKQVMCNFSKYSRKYSEFKEGQYPNVFTLEYSGGSLMDLNVYNIHICMHLFGKPLNYQYFPNLGRNGIDTSGVLIFQYPGFCATLVAAKDSTSVDFISIQGDAGTLRIDNTSPGACGHATFTKGAAAIASFSAAKKEVETISIEQNNNHMYYEIEAFAKMFENNDMDQCLNILSYSRDVLEVIETARKDAGIIFDAD